MRFIAILVFALVLPGAAFAHAHLDHATPKVGSTVAAPKEVVLWFTEKVEPKFSSIEVINDKGEPVQAGKASSMGSAALRVPVKPLGPGTYTVNWKVLSVDTHRSQGSFTFTVGR
jgi:methionine-rich copper-binding protein CopC